jgi:indole-3-glycerol phosphate synthase/phosphoribosylanthranilate isomerase
MNLDAQTSQVLDGILEQKRTDVARRKADRPLERVREGLVPSDRSFEAALRRPRMGFILECKAASPSRGQIRHDFDPAQIATSYAPFADAISVLTDQPFFGGELAYLRQVREAADVPVLCKDFVVDPYQVFEAREHGADAILLMMSVLDDETFGRCLEAATSLEIDVLCEVHDDAELERALAHPIRPPIIGVNNRNLKTMDVDLATAERLSAKIPDDRVVVGESGVSNHRDVLRLRPHCDALLVGSALMAADNLDDAVRQLVFGEVKVCGLTRPEDARAAFNAGATRLGVIFAEQSPRAVTPEQAEKICDAAPAGFVGVFVNSPIERVCGLVERLGLDAVQLHGDEDDGYIAKLRAALSQLSDRKVEIWQVERVDDELSLSKAGADAVLLDTFDADRRGGTGRSFDWSILSDADLNSVVLSGGLSPENAARADSIGARTLDVNSGVETAPGIKDIGLLTQFFAALRGYGKRGYGKGVRG